MNQKGATSLILVIVLVVLASIGAAYYFGRIKYPLSGPISPAACTLEAKVCPDGSSVGRSGPNCEFAACPSMPGVIDLAKEDLANTLAVDPGRISLSNYSPATWSDSGLGCPKQGFVYSQIVTSGYKAIFTFDAKQYEYHTDSGNSFISCP